MSSMTSRERVLTALNHKEPDKVPLVIGADLTTGINIHVYHKLKNVLGIELEKKYLYNWPELAAAEIDEVVLKRLGSDVRGIQDRFPEEIYERNKTREPHSPYFDDWGVGQPEIEPGVYYPGIHPLAEAKNIDDILNYTQWPDMNDQSRFSHVRERALYLGKQNQYAIMAAPWLLFPFERACQLQGMEQFLINMSINHDFAREMLNKISDLCKMHMENFLKEIGDNIDIIAIGDDLGTQENLLMSPKMYRSILKPIHADYISFIKDRTKAKIFFHTDGDVFSLIDDFIEIGVDILNPIQTSAGKMADISVLKKRYGKEICFCGAIDTQRVLTYGSQDEVRNEVRRVINALGMAGGYIVASVHTITREVPPENVLAMVDAIEEYGYYPLGD